MSNQCLGWKIALMRIVGIALVIAGLAAGYFWFYYLEPLRRISNPAWVRRHSDAEFWKEYQTRVQRSGWDHNGFGIIGQFGDKQAVESLMDHIRPGDDILSCASGHKAHGLRFLTNQAAGDSAEAWLAWWEQNKSKPQEDWICEGFRKHGLEIQTPLTQENVTSLLKLAARIDEEKGGAPDYVQYNAFRWLRDSDFEPDKFTVKDIPTKDADRVLQGLLRFSSLSTKYPKCRRIGSVEPWRTAWSGGQIRYATNLDGDAISSSGKRRRFRAALRGSPVAVAIVSNKTPQRGNRREYLSERQTDRCTTELELDSVTQWKTTPANR